MAHKLPTLSILSRKRFNEIKEVASDFIVDEQQQEAFLSRLCEIMKFDPERGTYTTEKGKRTSEYRKSKANEYGVSLYAVNRGKTYYEDKAKQCV